MDLIVYFTEDSSLFNRHGGNKRYENVEEYEEKNGQLRIEYSDERRRTRLPSSSVERYEEED